MHRLFSILRNFVTTPSRARRYSAYGAGGGIPAAIGAFFLGRWLKNRRANRGLAAGY